MDSLLNKKPITSAQSVLIHSILMLLRNQPMPYLQLKEVFNNSPLVYLLLLDLHKSGAISASNLENGVIKDSSMLSLWNPT